MNKIKLLILLSLFILSSLFNMAFSQNIVHIKIKKIYDGDTIKAIIKDKHETNEFSVRLQGIDYYETSYIDRAFKQAYKDNLTIDEVVKRGKESTLFLENLYKNNETSEIKIDFKGLDKYKRVLGILYFDNINVNEELIKNGGCKEYIYKRK